MSAGQHEALRTALDDLTGRLAAAGAQVKTVLFADRDQPHMAI